MPAISPRKAAALLKNLETNDEQFQADIALDDEFARYEQSLATFVAGAGEEVQSYFSGAPAYENSRKMGAAAIQMFPPERRHVLEIPGSWEIIFNKIRGQLQRDSENLTTEERAALASAFADRISVEAYKDIFSGRTPKLSATESRDLRRIGGVSAFLSFMERSE